jgi:hypothetical protein
MRREKCTFPSDLSEWLPVASLIRRLQLPTESKPESSSSHNGALPISEHTTKLIGLAELVKGEDTQSTDATASRYANPLGVSDVSDSEQYQGCRTMWSDFAYQHEQAQKINELERKVASLESQLVAKDVMLAQAVQSRQDAQAETGKALYGLPTEDKVRKEDYPLYSFMFGYFPDAWLAVVQVAVAGNKQHNPGQPLHWARGKSTDQMNTAWRHQWDYGRGVKRDTDGQFHLAKAVWRLMALQLDIEEERRQNGDK